QWCNDWERRVRHFERKRRADLRRMMERSARSARRRRAALELVFLLPVWRVLRAALAGDWRAAGAMTSAGFARLFAGLRDLAGASAALGRRIPALLQGRASARPAPVKPLPKPLPRRRMRRT